MVDAQKRFVYMTPETGELSVWSNASDSLMNKLSFRKDYDEKDGCRVETTITARAVFQLLGFECLGEL